MSGSVGLGNLALSLFHTGSSATSDILSALYGNTGSAGGSGNVVAALQNAEANSTKDIAQTASQPSVARDIAAFTAAVNSAKSPHQLLQNPTALKVLLTANGLGDQVQYPALAQKALLSDTTKSGALANVLPDTAWKSAAALFKFATQGLAVLKKPGVLSTITSGYAEVVWRQSLDQTTPGLSNALTFLSTASTFKTADQILGDSTARAVVTTALGIPEQIAFQSIGAQEKAITNRLDISKLQNPSFVKTLTTQYLLASQSGGSGSGSQDSTSLASAPAGLVV